ncbi:metallophosphoesterase [Lentzea californiensis]|uniref:metallophosphoesterase n=1 Tax=Lentzea californiensis TaxID=438851 RepID=UPI002165A7E8|nr:metallophosphoesterase [Lentzea californiensis]
MAGDGHGQDAAIGVVGGHADQLRRALRELGAGLVVIQVGDLVDRGPDSLGVLHAVRERLGTGWVQLVGNHEAQYLPGSEAFWPDPSPPQGVWANRPPSRRRRICRSGRSAGHSTVVHFGDRRWTCDGRIRQRATVDWQARHVRVRVGGRMFVGVDPGHGRSGASAWQPLVFDDAVAHGASAKA